jgi:hypothetical protein
VSMSGLASSGGWVSRTGILLVLGLRDLGVLVGHGLYSGIKTHVKL